MDLVRDLLDQQVLDRHGERMGRVDGVVLELRPGQPPRVSAIEVGLLTAARRVHPGIDRWRRWLAEPLRLPMAAVTSIGLDVEVDVKASATSAFALERWLRQHVIRRIPGAS
jgi:sporulation protein YlmC with PRC-barrel domain